MWRARSVYTFNALQAIGSRTRLTCGALIFDWEAPPPTRVLFLTTPPLMTCLRLFINNVVYLDFVPYKYCVLWLLVEHSSVHYHCSNQKFIPLLLTKKSCPLLLWIRLRRRSATPVSIFFILITYETVLSE